MAKRKSKTAKQRQARASSFSLKQNVNKKKKKQSFGGMTVTKASGGRLQQPNIIIAAAAHLNQQQQQNNNNASSQNASNKQKKKKIIKVIVDKKQNNNNNKNNTQQRKNDEQLDFDAQQRALQERSRIMQQKWNYTTKKKKNLANKNQAFFSFAPAVTFQETSKNTEFLLKEATVQVQAMDGIGQQQQQSNKNAHLLQSMARHTTSWQKQPQPAANTINSFAALENDDDDSDHETNNNENNRQSSLFQFAPPSFCLASSKEEDIDPDL